MYTIVATIQMQTERREDFVTALLDDARGSVQNEPGCLRFDIVQDIEDPNRLHLYEVYRDEAAFEAHLQAPHYVRWRDTVKDWYARPTVVAKGRNVFPTDADWHA